MLSNPQERHLPASICPVKKVSLKVQSEAIGPNQASIHDGHPEVSCQCGSLNFGISTPVSPIHVPSHQTEDKVNSQQGSLYRPFHFSLWQHYLIANNHQFVSKEYSIPFHTTLKVDALSQTM